MDFKENYSILSIKIVKTKRRVWRPKDNTNNNWLRQIDDADEKPFVTFIISIPYLSPFLERNRNFHNSELVKLNLSNVEAHI